ncbi:MAG: VWA domain-containing protein [Acidobacteriia bacterium]|nr:VWA domain-containing protein [Terriglobia bacterium]
MKYAFLTGIIALLLTAGAVAQQPNPPASDQDLPSAPSASIAPALPAPQPKAEAPKPAESPAKSAPALEDLPGSKKPSPPSAVAAPQTEDSAKTGAPQPTTQQANGIKAANTEDPTLDDRGNPLELTIRKRVDEVNVVFTVTDKHGHFVKNLSKSDFRVLDDHKPAASIVSFSSQTNLPLRVGLLVDASNSVRDRFRFEQESAIEFLNSIVRPKSDRAFVIGFDTTAEVTQDFTDSPEMLSRGVRMLRPGGGTAMYDAVYFASRDKLMKAPTTGPARRAIILLSDGDDNQSRVTREEAIEMAQRAEVIIYTISTNISGMKLRGDKVLERLADATGGRAFFPFKIQDVANAFAEIQDELRSQYLLAYKPADLKPDGRYRAIDIMAENHKNLRVRARKGYFAPTQ